MFLVLTLGILTQSVIAGVIVFLIFDGTFIFSIFGWRKWVKLWYDLRCRFARANAALYHAICPPTGSSKSFLIFARMNPLRN